MGKWKYSITILDLGNRGGGEESLAAIVLGAGWAPEPVWMLWSREKTDASVENRTPAVQPVAIPSEIPRLTHMT
jgi:hypothetical protein